MPASIGVNLRVTGNCRQGGRKYMEDCFSVAYQQTEDEKDLEYAFFGIYDGHGGVEAAVFAKEHLMETIIKHKSFWSDNDEDVLRAIKDGYIATHYAMWREQSKWPRTSSGLPSTAGTTASVAFIRRGKIYIGHVGDSGIILGYQEPGSLEWKAKPLTKDHKPETPEEMKRIESCGGKVVCKSGVPRVVWNRPKIGHQGPVRRSTPIDEIPFLAVARSLGDLWSYNSQLNQFVVSPDPDCSVLPIDTNLHRCLIFGSDGLFNMLSPMVAVRVVQQAELHNECEALSDDYNKVWLNPSKLLVERALERWSATKLRADNTSAVTLMLDPPGPPRAQVLKDRRKNLPESGLKIMTRYDGNASQESPKNDSNVDGVQRLDNNESVTNEDCAKSDQTLTPDPVPPVIIANKNINEKVDDNPSGETSNSNISISSSDVSSNYPLKERNSQPVLRENTSSDVREPHRPSDIGKENNTHRHEDNSIQINEISSSNIEESLVEDERAQISSSAQSDKNNRCVLRSSKKPLKETQEKEKKLIKRKMLDHDNQVQRKSLRLSLTQKFLCENKKPAPCTLAEEKLIKLAEEAEKSKSLVTQNKMETRSKNDCEKTNNNGGLSTKLSITQKILKSKKMNFKKKSIKKSQLSKNKFKLVLRTMLPRTGKNKVVPLNENAKKLPRYQGKCEPTSPPASLRSPSEKPEKEEPINPSINSRKASRSQEKTEEVRADIKTVESSNKKTESKNKKKKPQGKKRGLRKVVKSKKVISGKIETFKRRSARNASKNPNILSTKESKADREKVQKPSPEPTLNGMAKNPKKTVDISTKTNLRVLNGIKNVRRVTRHLLAEASKQVPAMEDRDDAKENRKSITSSKGIVTSPKKKSPKNELNLKNKFHRGNQNKTKSFKKSR